MNPNRFRELLEAQVGNLVVALTEKEVQIETLTVENTALKAELSRLKEPPDGPV